MEYFSWEQRLDLGIDLIDAQHRRIAVYINDLYSAVGRGDKGLVGSTILQLLEYTQSHLRFEEELLEAAAYTGLPGHRVVHGQFERRISHYYKRHNNGDDIAIPLLSELKLWLTTHIMHEDREYVPTLQSYLQGVPFPTTARAGQWQATA